jgi:two-component system phosphate regulon sensor histidine kinase PhoR
MHMDGNEFEALARLIESERKVLIARWCQAVKQLPSARNLDNPTLEDHIPTLVDDLVVALRVHPGETIAEAVSKGTPPTHGVQREEDGFDIIEVVAEYNILRACIHHLAEDHGVALRGKIFDIVNQILDAAIAQAVKSFADQRAMEAQRRREDYLAFVAHDLRTPLYAISVAVEALEQLQQTGISPAADQMLKVLHRNLLQLRELVDAVLKENINVKTEVGIKLERRTFDLWPLVEQLIHDLHPVAGTNSTRLINNIPADLRICADASLVRRIFQNLIANAIRYTQRGEVEFGARDRGGEGVECWVTDNGSGIPDDLIGKIFEKGESDPASDGTGLGLAIVKTFVEAHGGTIDVQSRPGEGSTFRFWLPRSNQRR